MYGALILFEDEFIHIVAISFSALILTELIMVALTIRTWHRLMVLAEIFSLILYLISLAVLHEIFGEKHFNSFVLFQLVIASSFSYRLGVHLVMGLLVEGVANHGGLLPTTIYHQISSQEILAAIVFEIIIEKLSETAQWPT